MIVKGIFFVPFFLLGVTLLLSMRALYKEDWSAGTERRIFFAVCCTMMSGLVVAALLFFGVAKA